MTETNRIMTVKQLKAGFASLQPWITRWIIDGRIYGGDYDAVNDPRIGVFQQVFPGVRRVLDLGSMECGHSIGLINLPGMEEVIAVEARMENIRRAEFVIRALEEQRITIYQDNLETWDFVILGQFDVCFCVGVLYHMPRPWELLTHIANVTRKLFLWTHYDDNKVTEYGGYAGNWHEEFGWKDVLSGLSPKSFWPTRADLLRMLNNTGWSTVEVLSDEQHKNGPAITIAAMKESGG